MQRLGDDADRRAVGVLEGYGSDAARHASLFLTNGGYSGVTLALAHGVPIVQAGTTEEKAEIAARIQWSGVGLTRPDRPKAGGGTTSRAPGPG